MGALWVSALLAAWGSGYFIGTWRESLRFRPVGFGIGTPAFGPWARHGPWNSRGAADDRAREINEAEASGAVPFGVIELFEERKP